jgi:phosphomannomutase
VDGDRIGFVTSDGKALSEEYALPLAAGNRLRRRPGPVVTNLSTSRMVEVVARQHGQPVIRTPVGESHVMDRGLAEGAILAGEGCGAVAALPTTMSFDGLLTLGLVLEDLATSGEGLAEAVAKLPRLVMRKKELPCPPNLVYRVLDSFRIVYAVHTPDSSDGIRVTWDDAWLHVRASNTEPLLRVIAEAETATRVDAILEEALTHARRTMFGHGIV